MPYRWPLRTPPLIAGLGGICAALAVVVGALLFADDDVRHFPVVCAQISPDVEYAHDCAPETLTRIRAAHKRIAESGAPSMSPSAMAGFASWLSDHGRLKGTFVLQRLQAGDVQAACEDITRWNKTRGVVDEHKAKRRARERELCRART